MRGVKTILGAAILALLAARAGAEGVTTAIGAPALPADTAELHGEVSDLRDAVASPATTNEKVQSAAFALFNEGIPATRIVVDAHLRGWDYEREIKGQPAEVSELIGSGHKRLLDLGKVPAPELQDAFSYADSMESADRIKYADDLDPRQMGVYRYYASSPALGTIGLSDFLKYIAGKVGNVFAFATIVHEAAHARDHQKGGLSPEAVLDGEVKAFQTQYLWLKMVDPYCERLATIRGLLEIEMKKRPSALTQMALNYATSLHVLEGTGGDANKIKEYVRQLGYEERDGSHAKTGPSA